MMRNTSHQIHWESSLKSGQVDQSAVVKYRKVEQEFYYPLALFMGCGVLERHLEMAKPTKIS